ncbi:MFS transporter [Acrocarpospora catenulata]|uniref:MFS transporter n=1 Tax=Acrocarpospora catenulata TaxID=2836182 RepID=UPI001BD9DC81|nr:MFS transporter [Acrocarpospora catenulata]
MKPARPGLVLAVCLLGIFVTTFPVTILTISVKQLAIDLHSTPSTITWVTTAPSLAAATATPLFGRLGDTYGHRRIYLAGLAVATVFAGLTATAWDAASVIAFRTISQTGAAAMVPSTYAILFSTYTGQRRVRASSLASATLAGAAVSGVLVGGPLVQYACWRAIFVVQLVASLGALATAIAVLPRHRPISVRSSLDLAGAGLLGAVTFAATFGLNRLCAGSTGLAAAALGPLPVYVTALVLVERRAERPLLPLRVLTNRTTALGCAVSFLVNAAWMGNFVTAPLLLQSVFGLSPAATSLALVPRTTLIVAAAPSAASLGELRGERRMLLVASGAMTLLTLTMAAATELHALAILIVLLATTGAALGHIQPALVSATSQNASEPEIGLVVSLQQTSSQVGGVIGIGVATAMAADSSHPGPFALVFVAASGCLLLATGLSLGLSGPRTA